MNMHYLYRFSLLLLCLLMPMMAISSNVGQGATVDINDILQNFARSFPEIQRLISGACYVIGILFALLFKSLW